jgi:DeoR family suf operon transcriptional repressor
MLAREVEMGALESSFSATKKRVLLLLKRGGSASLGDLAGTLRISKMATLKHMNALEGKGLVERFFPPGGRGRPRVFFRLTKRSTPLFPEAYAHMTGTALDFIERKLGRGAVEDLLKQRAQELYERNRGQLENLDLRGRVEQLAKIRDEGGYMAEVGSARKNTFELLEHNCPIYAVADKYWEACAVERDLFQKLLRADVETSHRVVAGDPTCRFLIRGRREHGVAGQPRGARSGSNQEMKS